jgi:hypothetical protein
MEEAMTLSGTVAPEEILKQSDISHPAKEKHVFLLKADAEGRILSVFSIGRQNNCEIYWSVQENYNREDPSSCGWRSRAAESRWLAEDDDRETRLSWARHFVRNGYVGICVYDEEGRYQYDPEVSSEHNKRSASTPDFPTLVKDRRVAVSTVCKTLKRKREKK